MLLLDLTLCSCCSLNLKNNTLETLGITERKLKSSKPTEIFFGVRVTKKYCQFTQKKFPSLKTGFYCENSKLNLPSEYPSVAVKNGKY